MLNRILTLDVVSNLNSTIETAIGKFNIITLGILIVMIFAIGAMLIYSEKSKEAAKSKIPWVLIGGFVMMGAVQIAKYVYQIMASAGS